MPEQIRDLSLQMQGDDVKNLQEGLNSLGFQVVDKEGYFGKTTRAAVQEFQKKHNLESTGVVDKKTFDLIMTEIEKSKPKPEPQQTENQKSNLVLGRVTDKLNHPLANLTVQAFNRDMRSDELLGESVTDKGGKYRITWSQNQLSSRSKKTVDIATKVFTREKKTLLFVSDIDAVRFNASPREEINITVTTAIQPEVVEYDYILEQVTQLAGKVAITDLQESKEHTDITFLSKEAEIPAEKIEHLVVAHRLSAVSKIDAAFFYALLRENTLLKNDFDKSFHARLVININTEIKILLYDVTMTDPDTIQHDVNAAVEEMIISSRVGSEWKQNMELLQPYKKEAEEYYKNEHFRKVLNIISRFVIEDKISEMNKIFQENKNDLNAFMQKITDESFFKPDEKADAATTSVMLGELLGFDEAIISQVKEVQKISKPEDVKKLAALNKEGWKEVLTRSADKMDIAGKPLDKELIDLHASSLARKMEREFPTVAFTAQLGREKKSILKNQKDISAFLSKHDDFDLQHSNIDLFIKEKRIATKKNEAMREELKSVQRVFKLVPHYSKTNALLKENIHSAQSIAAIGESRFVKEIAPKAGIEANEAKAIFRRAERTNTAAMLIVGELQDTMRAMNIPALEMGSLAGKLEKVSEDFPNLKSLFNLTDACACEHCRSVYSPAAYLVEILQFLDKRSVTDITITPPVTTNIAKDVLFERRPDLGEIDLSCENANTPVPYIDLVCELLEEAVAPDAGIDYPGALLDVTDPSKPKISGDLLNKLVEEGIPVTEQAQIFETETTTGSSDTLPHYLRDKKVVCKIANTGTGNYKVLRLRQTLSSAEELAAAPEYVNEEAYDTLKTSEYAFKLPFDLDHTEATAYFNRFDISRAELMKDFQSAGGPPNKAIAAEKLGLTDAERNLIVTPDAANQQKYWNAPSQWDTPPISGNVLDYMKRVDHFLDKTGLTYEELELLLSLKFIYTDPANQATDPVEPLFIKHLDLSCDTAKKEIANLDDAALDRIHRFLRLQKKTGWKFEVLDEIISQSKLGNGKLDDHDDNSDGITNGNECLIKAADLMKLSEETGIKIDELIGFYGEIPHQILNDASAKPLYHQVFLNKAKNGFIDEGFIPEKVDGSQVMSNFKTSISVCLQISEKDFDELLQTLPNDDLTFANLSYLFAAARLMRKLKLKTDDFLILTELTGLNISDSPEKTLGFVEAITDFKKSPLKAADVKFMLRHEPTFSQFNINLPVNDQKTLLKHLLSNLSGVDVNDVTTFTGFIDRTWTSPADAVSFIHSKLDVLFNTTQIVNALNTLANAAGPDIEPERKLLVKAFMDAMSHSDKEIKDDKIKQILETLRKGYQSNFATNKSPYDSNLPADEQKQTLQTALSKLSGIGEEDVKTFIKFIDGDWTTADAAKTFIHNKLNGLFDTKSIKSAIDELANALLTKNQAISDHEAALLAYQNAQNALSAATTPAAKATAQAQIASAEVQLAITLPALNSANENYEIKQKYLAKAFLDYYQLQIGKLSILEQTLATTFKADLELVKIILKYGLLKQATPNNDLISKLLQTDDLIDTMHVPPVLPFITEASFPKQFQSLRLLHKLFPLINSFKLGNQDIEWFFKNNKNLSWFEWDGIPYENGQTAIDYAKYIAFVEMIDLAKQKTPVPNPADAEKPVTFFTVAEMLLPGSISTRAEFVEKFSLLTGYSKEDVDAIDAHLFGDITEYRKVETWQKIEKCVEYLRKLGNTVEQVIEYIKPVLTSADVSNLRTALKARYDEDTWLSTLKEIMDAIRPQKRNALVSYLLAVNPEMKDENDLYDYFLVDVEMEAAMPSSRIVQAHGTVQLFVQRCLMGLEPQAAADVSKDKSWDQWKWMKNYRVWEANRKVFLYPENWIEAELRDDKSFLFTELENELLQNELTEFTAEDALIKYLEKLDNIAFLEVVATWYQPDIKTMHVFARTKGGDPAIYYYRKFEQERYWTPWEKVELDITGDYLLAFVRNNRLSLVWPIFSEEPAPVQKSKIPTSVDPNYPEVQTDKPKRKLKIRIAISEFANKKWQPKKISKEGITTPSISTSDEIPKEYFKFFYNQFADQITVFNSIFISDRPDSNPYTVIIGAFDITGCKGYPELATSQKPFNLDFIPKFRDTSLLLQRYKELGKDATNDLSVLNLHAYLTGKGKLVDEILQVTPGIPFRITFPHQFTKLDITVMLFELLLHIVFKKLGDQLGYSRFVIPMGTLLPYFMEDSDHAYVLIPGFYRVEKGNNHGDEISIKRTGSDVMQLIENIEAFIKKLVLYKANPTDEKLKELLDDFQKIVDELNMYRYIKKYGEQFKNMYHPLVCPLRKTLYKDGISELMKRGTQLQKTTFDFEKYYSPNTSIVPKTYTLDAAGVKYLSYPVEDIDFSSDGSYSVYNWELFFHVPFLLATRLTKDQRFEDALTWFHYMFNPTGALEGTAPQKYWITKPFYLTQDADYISQRIDTLLYNVANPNTPEIKDLEFAIDQWRKKPFKPHVVARFRPVAYQKALLMKYIDNFTQWGDYLFRQDTMESIVQATQMYILADKLLGPKPRVIPPVVTTPYETYNQIEAKLDAFGNALIDLENILPDLSSLPEGGAELPSPMMTLSMLYFCIPQNDKMLEYWDRIADRLFKIRHCQNIDGVERSLALFAPPIDPGMLVRAAAAGLDISAIIAGINAPTPYYRFNVLSQKATELAQEVRGLGSSLLQALEKKDAEAISLLRSELEIKVLNAVKDMKLLQIAEAKEQIEILKRTKAVTEERDQYYSTIQKIIYKEQLNLDKLGEAHDFQLAANITYALGAILALIPDLSLGVSGFGGSPHGAAKFGGSLLSQSTDATGKTLSIFSAIASYEASRASILGGYDRRFDDWKLQERLAKKELVQIDKQIVAAEIRKEIAETDLTNHELQIENAKKTDEFMHTKFTNKELYDWMIGQISSVYFSAYQLAHDFAKKAERCYRFEMGNDDSFISYGYWDSLKKGLQSADHLIHDIKRMETSYLDKNKREYEITKHVSLTMLDPLALLKLRTTGICDFDVPEVLYDMDQPGHYFRRIKSVSISLPCIAGPYTSVSAKLSLVSNRYRKNTNTDNDYPEDPGNDECFVYNVGAIQSIATSNAQNDSGMFELNFRDERYLPFENCGAISSWRLELPTAVRQFDYDTISDVILHVKYTAREGGSTLQGAAEGSLTEHLVLLKQQLSQTGLHIALNMKHDLPNAWHLFKKSGSVDLKIDKSILPYMTQSIATAIDRVMFLARIKDNPNTYSITIAYPTTTAASTLNLSIISDWNLLRGEIAINEFDSPFKLSVVKALEPEKIDFERLEKLEELILVVKYSIN